MMQDRPAVAGRSTPGGPRNCCPCQHATTVDAGVAQPYVRGVSTAVAESRELDIRSVEGRVVHVYDDGDPAGPLLVYHHGTPLPGLLPSLWVQVAQAEGVRLV